MSTRRNHLERGEHIMLEKNKQLRTSLTEGPLLGKILKFSLPLMATGILQTLYNAADMIVVGRFSDNGSFAMGAVGSCGSLINLMVNLFTGSSVGAGICVAQAVGAGREEDVKHTVHTSALTGLICGIFVGILGFLLSEPILLLMGTPKDILVEAVPYMQAYFVGMPAMLVYNFLAAALRSSGDTKRPLIFLSIAGLINVVFNIIMVAVFGMGAVGVGIDTTVSQYASALMIVIYMCRYRGICRLSIKEFKIHKPCLLAIIRNGLPAGLQGVVFSLSNVIVQSSINSIGPEVVTGNSAAANIEGFIYIAMNSLYQTAITFVGQNIGAGKIERVKKIALVTVAVVTVTGGVLAALCLLFKEQLLLIYVHETDKVVEALVINAGLKRMDFICTTYLVCGVMEVLCGVVRGMGRSLLPTLVSIFGSCLLRIAWVYMVCPFAPDSIELLYIAYPVTWIITSVGHLISCIWGYRSIKRERDLRLSAERESVAVGG